MFMHYKELDVYRLAYKLAMEIHHSSLAWPKLEQFGGMADQIRRSSKGICANIAEGLGKKSSKQEECRFLSIGLGSCHEVLVWISFARDSGYVGDEQFRAWNEGYERIGSMLHKLMAFRKAP